MRVEPHRCTAPEKRRLLGATPFFSALDDDRLDEVAERFDQRNFTAGETIEQLSTYPVPRRVAATLLALADRLGTIRRRVDGDDKRGVGSSGVGDDRGQSDEILIDATLSRQDLADMTGATVETVSRVLSDFRRRGWIDSGRQWVSVRDRASLETIAHG